MVKLGIRDETSRLELVVLGIASGFGKTPTLKEAYDPKSKEHIKAGTYPSQEDVTKEMEEFCQILEKHHVEILRPRNIPDLNQVFVRDIGIVIADKFIIPQILSNRAGEISGIRHIIEQVAPANLITVPKGVRIEGGDVMPWNETIFIGYSKEEDFNKYTVARTNEAGVNFLKENFPEWKICSFELNKSDTEPRKNALHLDCCLQPVGNSNAIIYENGFKNKNDFQYLLNYFGEKNCFQITEEEMYQMNSNVFSISPEIIVSEKNFTRLNKWLADLGFTVEKINYNEIAKMEGLLRCSTMPLRRAE